MLSELGRLLQPKNAKAVLDVLDVSVFWKRSSELFSIVAAQEMTRLLPMRSKQDSSGLPEMGLMKAHESLWLKCIEMSHAS